MRGRPAAGAAVILTVGNFDGVHLGHQALLEAAARLAEDRHGQVLAVTFEPHPRTVLQPLESPLLLTPLELKRRLLHHHGADRVLVLPFNQHLRELSPADFLSRLRARYAVVGIVAGPRLSIGRQGKGRLAFLTGYARRHGLGLGVVDSVLVDGREVSSSAIRGLVGAADFDGAAAMVGRPFILVGVVEQGDGRGRELGFPTANLRLLPAQLLPPDGVYAMQLEVSGGDLLPAVGSIGTRPHFGSGRRLVEVHSLVPPGDLYGTSVSVAVLRRLRGQQVFPTTADLVAQMRRDAQSAAAYLGPTGGRSAATEVLPGDLPARAGGL